MENKYTLKYNTQPMKIKFLILTIFLLSTTMLYAQGKKVLFIMSAAKELPLKNGKTYNNTGVFLNEFYLAYREIAKLGYDIDFATPNGITSSIDKESFKLKYWKGREDMLQEAREFVCTNQKFNSPMTLENIIGNTSVYSGMVVPGGQGLMVDLIHNCQMAEIIKLFSSEQKAIGLICNAQALLI